MSRLLNIQALKNARVHRQPFPFFVLEQALHSDKIEQVMRDFPVINEGGSFTLDDLDPGPSFKALMEELKGPEFRQQISAKLELDLSSLPMIVTLRGLSRARDGRVHSDSISKIATILIYFNDGWTPDTGKLRILHSKNMEDMHSEVVPNAGTMLAFRVTDNCWHGYPAFEGRRRAVQINFVADATAVKKHHHRHGFTAKLKSLKKLFG